MAATIKTTDRDTTCADCGKPLPKGSPFVWATKTRTRFATNTGRRSERTVYRPAHPFACWTADVLDSQADQRTAELAMTAASHAAVIAAKKAAGEDTTEREAKVAAWLAGKQSAIDALRAEAAAIRAGS